MLTSKWFLIAVALASLSVVLLLLGQKSVKTTLHVSAPVNKVWSVITNTKDYEHWNPVFKVIEGHLYEGTTVTYHFAQDSNTSYDIETKVKKIVPEKCLNQGGGTIGILTFNHHYLLEEKNGGTQLSITEAYSGIAVPFWNPTPVGEAYQTLAQAIKARAEKELLDE